MSRHQSVRKPSKQPTVDQRGGSFGLAHFQAEWELAERVGGKVFDGTTSATERKERMRRAIAAHELRHLYEPDFERLYGEPVGVLL